ncbi:hypothetical protein V8F20_004775 [Naviculisporaceae sp. PSN 640]
MLKVARIYPYEAVLEQAETANNEELLAQLKEWEWKDNEWVLSDEVQMVRPENAGCWLSVVVDRHSGDFLDDPSPPLSKRLRDENGKRLPQKRLSRKYTLRPVLPEGDILIRCTIDTADNTVRAMSHVPPLRAELELKEFGREHFEQNWDIEFTGYPVISCPVLTFIDGFGLYRNTRRSVMGMYQIPAGLESKNRGRHANIFPMVLGPHATNFDAVIEALGCLLPLDKGIMMEINGVETFVSVFTMCYTGDMPQQDKNTGTLGPTALKFCRFCYIGPTHVINEKDVLSDDFYQPENLRYHHQMLQMRHEIENVLTTGNKQKAYSKQWGINQQRPALFDLSPALDVILSRPSDPAHSEYKGVTAFIHEMLIKAILTPSAVMEYARVLRSWPFPPGWTVLPSPVAYLKSYDLTAHAKWSIIIPPLLRHWLREKHINPYVWDAWKEVVEEEVRLEYEEAGEDFKGVEETFFITSMVKVFADIARSNHTLMCNRNLQKTAFEMHDVIFYARSGYVRLCRAVATGLSENPRARSAFSTRDRPSMSESLSSRARSVMETDEMVLDETIREEGIVAGGLLGSMQDEDVVEFMAGSSEDVDNGAGDKETTGEDGETTDNASESTGTQTSRKLPRTADKYFRNSLRPNVHIGMHYWALRQEYGLVSQLHVLAEETYHRRLKAIAETLNGREPERFILERERITHTIRFILLHAFAYSDPALTDQMDRLMRTVPSLFEPLLHRQDKLRMGLYQNSPWDEDQELEIEITEDPTPIRLHLKPTVIGKLNGYTIGKQTHPVCSWVPDDGAAEGPIEQRPRTNLAEPTLPLSKRSMSEPFQRQLRAAYEREYGILTKSFFPGQVQYSDRVAFSDSEHRRHVFRVGDFIRYHGKKFGIIDYIFVHDQIRPSTKDRRIFLILSRYARLVGTDPVLRLHKVRDAGEPIIIGLPAVETERLYIVKINNREGQTYYVEVDWDIIWL